MTRRERLLHATAFEVTRCLEEILALPRQKRARMFFELFVAVKRGLEGFSLRISRGTDRIVPGSN